jgi:hypothetical protein
VNAERQRHVDLLRRAVREIGDPPPAAGRGIVTCASVRHAAHLWILVRSLRYHGCRLPIEVWHLRGEVTDPLRRFLSAEGVAFCDAGDVIAKDSHLKAAHALKPYAIAHSPFREVLFLDADNSAFRDPTFLFDTAEFARHRAIFWPDAVAVTPRWGGPELRRDFGLRADGPEFESGQIVIDKVDRWPALALTLHVNEYSAYYYRFLSGDKETFRLAFDVLAAPYFLVARMPASRHGLIHTWTDERPLFHHRCGVSKHAPLRPANVPALPRDEVRAILAAYARQRRAIVPRQDRVVLQQQRLRAGIRFLARPRAWREAITKRMRRRPGPGRATPGA